MRLFPGPPWTARNWIALSIAAFALLLLFCDEVPAQEGKIVREIVFKGLRRIPGNLIRQKIVTKAGEPFSRQRVTADINRLHAWGKFTGDIRVEIADLRDGVRLIFLLTEREPIKKIVFEGRESIRRSVLEEDLATKPGKLLNPYLLSLDRRGIARKYLEKGYLFVQVSSRVRPVKGGVEVVFKIDEGPEVRVERIRFLGNASIRRKDLLKVMETKERRFFGLIASGDFQREKLERDLDVLTRYYRSQGYLDARVMLENISFNLEKTRVSIDIRAVEGVRYRIRSIRFQGNTVIPDTVLREKIALKDDGPFLGDALTRDLRALTKAYSEKAYIFTRVNFQVAYLSEPGWLNLTFDVKESEKIRIGKVEFQGNIKTRDDVIRRKLSFYPGEYFNSTRLDESFARLYRMRYFENIELDFEDGRIPNEKNMIMRFKEAQTGSFLLGAGLSSTVGFFGNIVFTQRNFDITDVPKSWNDFLDGTAFVGAGQNLTIQLQPGKIRSRYRISFAEPYFLGFPVVFSTNIFIYDRDRGDYTEGRIGGSMGFGYRLTKDSVVDLTYRLERVYIYDIESDAIADVVEVSGRTMLASAKLGYRVNKNKVDRYFVYYGGYGYSVHYEIGSEYLGSDVEFNRVELSFNAQTTLFRWPEDYKHVIGIRGLAGWQRPFGKTDEMPLFERFYAGGPRTIRGFEYRSVGPQEDDEPIGGDAIVVGSLEYGYPIFKDILRGIFFVDTGMVAEEFDELDLERFRISAGFGFRIKVPIFPAPVALDFGFPLKEEPEDDHQMFSFTLGIGI
jgi:outer membrane protein insertion porin family